MSSALHSSVENLVSLTLPELVEYRLCHNSDDTFILFPGQSAGDEPSRITYLEFGRAVQRFARAVQSDCDLKEGDVVGVIANCDALLYITAIVGLLHNGVTVFPMSPRNSGAAINSMLRKVDAHKMMIASSSVLPLINEVKSELVGDDYRLDVMQLPSFSTVYPWLASESEADPFEAFPFKSRDALVGKTALYIHSSGSTGFPKPIPWTTEYINRFFHSVLVKEMMTLPSGTVLATPGLPSFHAMGVMMYLLLPLMTLKIGGMFRPSYPNPPQVPSPQTIIGALREVRANSTTMIPSILEELSYDASAVSYLSQLIFIGYGGGPLSKAIGDKLVKAGCRLRIAYGSTEIGVVGSFLPPPLADPEEWEWLAFGDNMNIDWAWQADGSAELRFIPCATHVPAIQNMPGPEGGYATNDLWVPHPTKANLWKIVGRVDDVLILANGEKVVPGPTEGALLVHPFVHSAVMFGRERTQVGILVEPAESHVFDPADESALAAFRNAIWTTVEEANSTLPAFGRLYKEMILVTHPSKPLPRVAKGTVNRKAALREYEEEINAIYEAVERPAHGSSVSPPVQWTTGDVQSWLQRLASSIREGEEIKADIDLFQQGFDSLSATFLRNSITAALRASSDAAVTGAAKKIGPNFIYNQPVLQDMAVAIMCLLRPETADGAIDPVTAVHAMIERYTQDMASVHHINQPKPAQEVVLLTGSTGGLGSQLLVDLLEVEKVAKVYVLNRASARSSSLERHEHTFRDRGLDPALLQSPKLTFLEGEVSAENFGLLADQYEELRSSITIIIHNAWQLNFNLSLTSFESHIHGTRRLVDLAFASLHAEHVRVMFTSSVGVTQSWPRERGAFPEEPQDDARWCIGSGYGEAKYVAEQILVKAANHGLQTTSFRIGQIAGGYANGAWATTDWLPIMLASAVSLGSLPDAVGLTSWTPTDVISQAILDVAFTSGTLMERALNLVHPHPVPWSTVMENVADVFVEEGITSHRLPLVPVEDWVGQLTKSGPDADADTFERIPALKLLNFFGGMAHADSAVRSRDDTSAEAGGLTRLSTDKAQRASSALRNALPLGVDDVQRWVRYWAEKGLLTSSR